MDLMIKQLGLTEYQQTFAAMQYFSQNRTSATADELWLCQHQPVFTLGITAKTEHILCSSPIPLVVSNRGGQVTYHGPGQLVAYPLINLKRRGWYIKSYINKLEQAVIETLAEFGIGGYRVEAAPGVYVDYRPAGNKAPVELVTDKFRNKAKIAALGVKVEKYCTYHGIALNVAMDLTPYSYINPCGFRGLTTIDMQYFVPQINLSEVNKVLVKNLVKNLAVV